MGPWSDPKSEFSGTESPDPDPRESQKCLLGSEMANSLVNFFHGQKAIHKNPPCISKGGLKHEQEAGGNYCYLPCVSHKYYAL